MQEAEMPAGGNRLAQARRLVRPVGREVHHRPALVGIAHCREHLAGTAAEVGMTAMRAFAGAIESEGKRSESGRSHSAATARPICSQVGATSETVARRISRL